MKAWLTTKIQSLNAWLAGHPAVKNFVDGTVSVAVLGVVAYVKGTADPQGNIHLTETGITAALWLVLKPYWTHQIETFLLADATQTPAAKLSAFRAMNPTAAASGSSTGSTPGGPAGPMGMGGGKKLLLAMMILALGTSTAEAGYGLPGSSPNGKFSIDQPAGPVEGVYALPIGEFQVGASLPNPTYGIAITEDLVWGKLFPVTGGVNMSPYFGLGASLYADAAGVINNNGPLVLMGGVNVIGPNLDLLGLGNGQGLVPAGQAVFNFQTGEMKVTGGLSAFLDIFPTQTIHKVF